ALGAYSGNNLILIVPLFVTISTKSSFSATSFVNCDNSNAFKSTLLAVVLSAVDVLFELSADELGEVVLFAEQPAAN
ncbi:hypothetical protein, partial [Escherichia coli]|uniref:hypothetical protein n=1 Tax=Escherichia coli TaxID=562 RepID=UPI003CE83D36